MSFLDDISADLPTFVDSESGFAKSATYIPAGGSASTVKVIFDEAFQLSQPADVGFADTAPRAIGRTSDFPAARNGDRLVVDGVTYHVLSVQPDGTGISELKLSRDLQVPVTPSGLSTNYAGGFTFTLTWTLNSSSHTAVEVYRSTTGAEGSFIRIASLAGTAVNYNETAPVEGTFHYRVRAMYADGPSAWSNTLTVVVVN